MFRNNIGYDVNPRGTDLFVVQLVFLLMTWIISVMRGYVKIHMVKSVSPDDYWMLAALLLYTTYSVIVLHGVTQGGTGKHSKELTTDGAEIALRAWYLCEVLYAPLSACIRTSIATFLLRLAVQKWHRWIIYIILVITWVVSVGFFVPMVVQCLPPSYFWKQVKGAEGRCIHPAVVPITAIAHGIVSAICDWVLGLLPIAILWDVQINRRTKVVVAALLSMGLVAGAALIVRIPFIKTLAISLDFLYETVGVAIWSVLEPGLGIMAGSIATLRPLALALGCSLSTSKKYISNKMSRESKSWHSRRSRRSTMKLGDEPRGGCLEEYPMRPRSNSLEIRLLEARAGPAEYDKSSYVQSCPWNGEPGLPPTPPSHLGRVMTS